MAVNREMREDSGPAKSHPPEMGLSHSDILRFCVPQHWDIGISAFPQCEELLVRLTRPGLTMSQCSCSSQFQIGECMEWKIENKLWTVKDPLELGGRRFAPSFQQVGFTA